MYSCRSAGLRSGAGASRPPAAATEDAQRPSTVGDLPTAEQAGLLLGLGLNGHLNKITPYDIGEYLIRVHDLHNMALLIGASCC